MKKAQVNNKISSFHFSNSLFSTQVAPCFDYDIKVTHESTAGMKNKSTITEVINPYDASNEKVRRKDNSFEDTPSPMGRLQKRYDEWENVTSTPFILGVIREGYKYL